MKISMRTDYGVRAVVELAARFGSPPVPSSEVAVRQEIPEPYLDQLLVALRKAGLVRSTRGPQGGHSLSKEPADMTLGEVVSALEGHGPPVACINEDGTCQLDVFCPQRDVWLEVDRVFWNALDKVTIAELAARQENLESRAMYHI